MSWLSRQRTKSRPRRRKPEPEQVDECLREPKIVLHAVRAEGVDCVRAIPAARSCRLYDALEGSGIRHVLTRTSRARRLRAEGYARVTGKSRGGDADQRPRRYHLVTGNCRCQDGIPSAWLHYGQVAAVIGTECFSGD